jgi:hypothetical protein
MTPAIAHHQKKQNCCVGLGADGSFIPQLLGRIVYGMCPSQDASIHTHIFIYEIIKSPFISGPGLGSIISLCFRHQQHLQLMRRTILWMSEPE